MRTRVYGTDKHTHHTITFVMSSLWKQECLGGAASAWGCGLHCQGWPLTSCGGGVGPALFELSPGTVFPEVYPGACRRGSYRVRQTHRLVLDWQGRLAGMPISPPLSEFGAAFVRDAFSGQRRSIVAALWPGKQAAGFEVPAGFAQAGARRLRRGLQASPKPGRVC